MHGPDLNSDQIWRSMNEQASLAEKKNLEFSFAWFPVVAKYFLDNKSDYTLISCLSTSHMPTCSPLLPAFSPFFPSFPLGLFGSDVLYSWGDCWITSQSTGETTGVSKSFRQFSCCLKTPDSKCDGGTPYCAKRGVKTEEKCFGPKYNDPSQVYGL